MIHTKIFTAIVRQSYSFWKCVVLLVFIDACQKLAELCVGDRIGRNVIVSYLICKLIKNALFGFIIMFDRPTAIFLLSFDTDCIGWKHQA